VGAKNKQFPYKIRIFPLFWYFSPVSPTKKWVQTVIKIQKGAKTGILKKN